MSRTLADLLSMDDLARRHGCGLNPRLRDAIETDLRYPAKAASPRADPAMPIPEGEGIIAFAPVLRGERKKA